MNDLDKTAAYQPDCPDSLVVMVKQPTRIHRYRIDKILGEGGFGLVYLAQDEQLQRFVAIKVPHRNLVNRPEAADAYLTEARTVANLDHPHIVPVHDVGSMDEFPCYKEQFLRFGQTFRHNEMKCYPEPTCPIGRMVWHDAAAYCNWLSKQESIDPTQWC